MKLKYKVRTAEGEEERTFSYIPLRFIAAILLSVAMTLAVIGIVLALCHYVSYFYLAAMATQVAAAITIIASSDNPDYKIPWLVIVLLIPVGGFMLYYLFYSRKPDRKYRRRMPLIRSSKAFRAPPDCSRDIYRAGPPAATQAKMLCTISGSHIYPAGELRYFPLGEDMFAQMLRDLQTAERFIFLEYFIIEEGLFWNSILDILKEKAAQGVEVKLIYDDIGCMMTLPGNYYQTLRDFGIEAVPFAFLKGNADSEFNNRSHRKLLIIDGKIGYTGGVNLADEYINAIVKYGHWKDIGIRLAGSGVQELTKLFFEDFSINSREMPRILPSHFPQQAAGASNGYVVPFGDGPRPFYRRQVGKCVIQNMLASANRYMWIMSPYLVIDNELCMSLENAALRGVDVRIIVPHIPDKQLIFEMTRSSYPQLMEAGVKIYEYTPGFIHAKCYLADSLYAMVGTINLDYRSLVHHYEDGVWMYRCPVIDTIRDDFTSTFEKSRRVRRGDLKTSLPRRVLRAALKLFAPMM